MNRYMFKFWGPLLLALLFIAWTVYEQLQKPLYSLVPFLRYRRFPSRSPSRPLTASVVS